MSNESQNPSKRQRLEILAPSNQNELLLLLDLPLQQQIIPFLSVPDRLNLAETCRHSKKEVDAYCEKVLEKITGPNDRNVDGSFHERIRDQTSIITKRTKPVHLPPRYLLWVALRKEPLYKIQLYDGFYNVERVFLSPSENQLVAEVAETDDQFHIFDLQTRQKLTKLANDETTVGIFLSNTAVFLDDTCITTFTVNDDFILCTHQGGDEVGNHNWTMRNLYQADGDVYRCVRLCPHSVLFAAITTPTANGAAPNQERLIFQTLDTRNPNVDADATLVINLRDEGFSDEYPYLEISGMIDQKWLLFLIIGDGLYVYNLETKTKNFVWKGDNDSSCFSVHQSSACPRTFCVVLEICGGNLWRVVVLQLDTQNGRLYELSSFPVNHQPTILGFSATHLFFTRKYDNSDFRARGKVEAFHVETGNRDWSIELRYPREWTEAKGGVANARNELIVVMNLEDIGDCYVYAFCLEEPQL